MRNIQWKCIKNSIQDYFIIKRSSIVTDHNLYFLVEEEWGSRPVHLLMAAWCDHFDLHSTVIAFKEFVDIWEARDLAHQYLEYLEHFNMRIWIYLLVLGLVAYTVSAQRNSNRNNNNRNNRFRNGRQQGNRNRRPSRNQNANKRPKAGAAGKCRGGNQPNHKYQGKDFLVSWRVGCSKFTQSEGESFCRANGMKAISIDSSAKEREFLGLVAKDRQRYFWTGGKVNQGNIRWPSKKRYNDVNWSNTGGWGHIFLTFNFNLFYQCQSTSAWQQGGGRVLCGCTEQFLQGWDQVPWRVLPS